MNYTIVSLPLGPCMCICHVCLQMSVAVPLYTVRQSLLSIPYRLNYILNGICSMLIEGIFQLFCLHGSSPSGRLVGGVWHSWSFRIYLTVWLPCRMAPSIYGPKRRQARVTGRTLEKQQLWQYARWALSKMGESTLERLREIRETCRLWRMGELRDD